MITASDKLKVTQYVMQHASGDLYYEDFKEFMEVKAACASLRVCRTTVQPLARRGLAAGGAAKGRSVRR